MRTQASVENLLRRLYRQIGSDPTDLVQVKPIDGGWPDALSYTITRTDGKRATVFRRDLDDLSEEALSDALREFK
jgi:hypothetical protein